MELSLWKAYSLISFLFMPRIIEYWDPSLLEELWTFIFLHVWQQCNSTKFITLTLAGVRISEYEPRQEFWLSHVLGCPRVPISFTFWLPVSNFSILFIFIFYLICPYLTIFFFKFKDQDSIIITNDDFLKSTQ